MKTLFAFILSVVCTAAVSQDYLGWEQQPSGDTAIDALPDFGALGDFSGGVGIGDFMPDFTVYDLNGESITFYEELRPDRYTILFNLSLSCDRVVNGMNASASTQLLSFIDMNFNKFNWLPIYTAEAHPFDLENCPSNCPAFPTFAPDGDTIWSHQTYLERQLMAQDLLYFGDSEEYPFFYPFDRLFLDNPDNAVLVEITRSPFAMVVVDCAGKVVEKAEFMNQYFNSQENVSFLLALESQADSDGDGICDLRETDTGSGFTDPCDPIYFDSDQDGYCDVEESLNGWDPADPCDPVIVDLDGDGQCDFSDNEPTPCELDPTDSDGDGVCDAQELLDGTNPNNPCSPNGVDSDGDGYCDLWEAQNETGEWDPCDPDNTDTDGDGFCDMYELTVEGDPNDPCTPNFIDSDGDGLCNLYELQNGSSPADACDPLGDDSDGDGLCDVQEGLDGTDPNDPCDPQDADSDGDGLCDTLEELNDTDPGDACDPDDTDSDADGLCDVLEVVSGSDPEDACDPDDTDSDGDGVCDIQEIIDGTDPNVDENAVSVSEWLLENVSVFPNPVVDQLTVRSPVKLDRIQWFSPDGRLLRVDPIRNAQATLDVSDLASGVYVVQLWNSTGAQLSVQVVK